MENSPQSYIERLNPVDYGHYHGKSLLASRYTPVASRILGAIDRVPGCFMRAELKSVRRCRPLPRADYVGPEELRAQRP